MWSPLETIAETMHRRVCPLYTLDSARRVQVIGSAVPFNSNGFRFLITATHVCLRRGSRLSVPVFTTGHDMPRFLSGRRIAWEYQPGTTPDLDLSVIELTDEEALDLEHQYQFTTPAETAKPKPKTPGIHYIIAGYPAARNKFISHRVYPSAIATHLITGDIQSVQQLALPDKTDDTHFALSLPFEKVPRLNGGDFRVPKAAGMSGGGVWRIDIDIPHRLATTPLLVGIGIEHHKAKGLFIATRVEQAIPLARDLAEFVAAGIRPDSAGT